MGTGAGYSGTERWAVWMRPPLPVAWASIAKASPSAAGAGARKLNVHEALEPPVSEQAVVEGAAVPEVTVTRKSVRTPDPSSATTSTSTGAPAPNKSMSIGFSMLTVGAVVSIPSEVKACASRVPWPRGSTTIRSYSPAGTPAGTTALRMPTLTHLTSSRAKLSAPGGDSGVETARLTRVALNPLTSMLALPATVSN